MTRDFAGQFDSDYLFRTRQYLILFLIWPFLAFITALANYRYKESQKVVYLFLIYYGLTFVIVSDFVDAATYAERLKITAALPFSDFFKIVGGIYSSDTSVDIVQPLITFIVSRFTESYRVLFAAYAALFGFFYLKSINLLYDNYRKNPDWNGLIPMAFFTAILPITLINGVRMWTAAWIFFYGAYHVILYRDPKYLIVTMGACLVHFSYLSVNAILIIYYFAGNRNFIYFPLMISSFIVPKLFTPYLHALSLKLGGGLESRINMYTNEYYMAVVQQRNTSAAWFMQIGYDLLFYFLIFAILIIHFWDKGVMKGKSEKNLFSFVLLFLTFVNFAKSIPSLGSRFQLVFFLFATLYVFLFLVKMPKGKLNPIAIIGIFPMLLYTAITYRQGSDSINAWLFMPGCGLPLFVGNLSIADIFFH